MKDFDPRTSFGDAVSRRYDAEETRGDEGDTVEFLLRVAAGRDALELAIGTGRIALPLARRGLCVDGIELSPDMVARLREKDGGEALDVTIGDMSRDGTGQIYGLVYLVYNTIGNLLTQEDQVRCFENAARHLHESGAFVLECRIPVAPAWSNHRQVSVERVEMDHVALDVSRYDPVTQLLDDNHVRLGEDGVALSPIRLRLANPPEFDLMARLAGLRLRARWGGWNGEPFTASSRRHVSVYEPAGRG